jgi:anti-sigma factor RsiW
MRERDARAHQARGWGPAHKNMFCDEALDAIEPIAAGELTPDGRIADHLATCPNCAAALDSARQLERLLQARPVPPAPAQFPSRTMAMLRRQRWRSEQYVDVGFNVALGALGLALIIGIAFFVNRAGLISVGSGPGTLLGGAFTAIASRVAPSLPLYLGATALLAMALGIWWWAERDAI